MADLKEPDRIEWLHKLSQALRRSPARGSHPLTGMLQKEILEPVARGLESWSYGDRFLGPKANAPLVNERTMDMAAAAPVGLAGKSPGAAKSATLIAATLRDPITRKAAKMMNEGATVEEIWKETGRAVLPTGRPLKEPSTNRWMYDQRWMKEIPDKEARIKPEHLETIDTSSDGIPLNVLKPQKHVKLRDYMDHPELYAAQPGLGDTNVAVGGPRNKFNLLGSYDPNMNLIHLNDERLSEDLLRNPMSTLLHETQHAVQERSNWPRGTTPSAMKLDPEMQEKIQAMYETAQKNPGGIYEPHMLGNITRTMENPHQQYQKVLGEQQARSTQLRRTLRPEVLKENSPLKPTWGYDNPRGGFTTEQLNMVKSKAKDLTVEELLKQMYPE